MPQNRLLGMAAVLASGVCAGIIESSSGSPMATRTGDLDPGVLVHLMRDQKMSPDELDELVNHKSGLLGISESSSDMRDLLARQATDERARDAVSIFCYQTKKWIGAFVATCLATL